jgi:hypothetical protein
MVYLHKRIWALFLSICPADHINICTIHLSNDPAFWDSSLNGILTVETRKTSHAETAGLCSVRRTWGVRAWHPQSYGYTGNQREGMNAFIDFGFDGGFAGHSL